MNNFQRSFRSKLAFAFALFGVLISLILSIGLFVTTHQLGIRLMDETLSAEIDDFLSRRQLNPRALLPSTITIKGYLQNNALLEKEISPELARLEVGNYQRDIAGVPYHINVIARGDEKFVMLFNATQQQEREFTFLIYLGTGILLMSLLSAWLGWLLAGKIVRPISELSNRVSIATPESDNQKIAAGFSPDEVGNLANVFSNYLNRIRAFIDRERAFTSDVSHEMRTPLAIIQGVIELMEDDSSLDIKQKERIARISRANQNMIETTSALLLMAREENANEPIAQLNDVYQVVCDVVEANRHLLSANTKIEVNCLAHISVPAERTLLSIVIANLIRNAFAYTPSGVVSIVLNQSNLTITDTGYGISNDEIDKVFNRHYRGSSSSGAGIGLSLVKRICERYGWTINIQSAVNQGTQVTCTF